MKKVWCYKLTHVKDQFKVQNRPMDYNKADYAIAIDMVSDSVLH